MHVRLFFLHRSSSCSFFSYSSSISTIVLFILPFLFLAVVQFCTHARNLLLLLFIPIHFTWMFLCTSFHCSSDYIELLQFNEVPDFIQEMEAFTKYAARVGEFDLGCSAKTCDQKIRRTMQNELLFPHFLSSFWIVSFAAGLFFHCLLRDSLRSSHSSIIVIMVTQVYFYVTWNELYEMYIVPSFILFSLSHDLFILSHLTFSVNVVNFV